MRQHSRQHPLSSNAHFDTWQASQVCGFSATRGSFPTGVQACPLNIIWSVEKISLTGHLLRYFPLSTLPLECRPGWRAWLLYITWILSWRQSPCRPLSLLACYHFWWSSFPKHCPTQDPFLRLRPQWAVVVRERDCPPSGFGSTYGSGMSPVKQSQPQIKKCWAKIKPEEEVAFRRSSNSDSSDSAHESIDSAGQTS